MLKKKKREVLLQDSLISPNERHEGKWKKLERINEQVNKLARIQRTSRQLEEMKEKLPNSSYAIKKATQQVEMHAFCFGCTRV